MLDSSEFVCPPLYGGADSTRCLFSTPQENCVCTQAFPRKRFGEQMQQQQCCLPKTMGVYAATMSMTCLLSGCHNFKLTFATTWH